MSNLSTTIIKSKNTRNFNIKLMSCLFIKDEMDEFCNEVFKKEIISTLNRRIIIPFYIPILALISALLLIKSTRLYFHKSFIFIYRFVLLVIY